MKGTIKFLFLFFILFGGQMAFAAPIVADSFSTTWDTGATLDIEILLGTCADSVYWEEIGNEANNGTSFVCGGSNVTVVAVPSPGQYRVDFSGSFTVINISFFEGQAGSEFRTVEQWGNSTWTSMQRAFQNITNLEINATDAPDLSSVSSMVAMFRNATNFNDPIGSWDVSNVTNMREMFTDATSFNQSLNSWNVSNVTDMSSMFSGATSFNQPLNSWNVSSVTDFSDMFLNATAFNQDVSDWQIEDGDMLLNMFRDSGLSPENYSYLLIDWAALSPAATSIDLGIISTTFCSEATTARTTLTDTYFWSITDLGAATCVGFMPEPESESVSETRSGSGTIVGLRQKRLDDLQNSLSSSTAPVSEKLTNFVSSLKKFLSYLTTHEDEIKNLSPEESKAVIIVLRDAILELLKWLPGGT